ncbi:low molecular weight protein arginine phosphatase [Rubritalea tangerina]|uniref:protein-tyrosine-phosphatase n=1 Tax=Rubritalea tangerina TaxID=430798 RepID=A0ABW4ZDJ4_9BACT
MQSEKRVLFICTGNTCRSPMAEGIFRKAIKDHEGLLSIGSAGVAAYDGDRISPESADELESRGASLNDFRSRSVTEEMLEQATHVFAMTAAHLHMLTQAFPGYAEKCYLVCDFIEINGKAGIDVPDPIGMGKRAYQQVGEVFEYAIPALIAYIENEDAGHES